MVVLPDVVALLRISIRNFIYFVNARLPCVHLFRFTVQVSVKSNVRKFKSEITEISYFGPKESFLNGFYKMMAATFRHWRCCKLCLFEHAERLD